MFTPVGRIWSSGLRSYSGVINTRYRKVLNRTYELISVCIPYRVIVLCLQDDEAWNDGRKGKGLANCVVINDIRSGRISTIHLKTDIQEKHSKLEMKMSSLEERLTERFSQVATEDIKKEFKDEMKKKKRRWKQTSMLIFNSLRVTRGQRWRNWIRLSRRRII